ncbi:MAG TPA: class II aldolase/adducin family protein [Clostridia bacterium]|nr:class II aldolase/adducin family protein [Clostridia bacterium]
MGVNKLTKREEAKRAVVETGQRILTSGLVVGTWGNVSARVPGEPELVAITPSGMDYMALTEEDIVLLDLSGNLVEGRRKPSIEVPLHLAVYQARPEVNGVVHVHSVYATAWAAARQPVPGALEDLVQIVGGEVRVSRYALPGTRELAQYAVEALENRMAALLANHGLIALGRDLPEALKTCQVVEKAAQALLYAKLLGGWVELSRQDIAAMREFFLHSYGQR